MSEATHYLEGYLPQVKELARHLGVDTDWWDFAGNYHQVDQLTLVKVLDALGFPLQEPQDIDRAYQTLDEEYWLCVLQPGWVLRQSSQATIPVHVPDGTQLQIWLETEQGQTFELSQTDKWVPSREIAGKLIGEANFTLPQDLELGYHTLRAQTVEGEFTTEIAVVPDTLSLGSLDEGRSWGLMTQLYSVTSRDSWGMGDFGDLASLGRIFGHLGADFILTNPLHAGEPSLPITPSPYLPVTRRFVNPLYIRPDSIPEFGLLDSTSMAKVKVAFAQATNDLYFPEQQKQVDRNRSWKAKREALELIFRLPRSHSRQRSFRDFKEERGKALDNFALWCALCNRLGKGPWEGEFRDINSETVAQVRQEAQEEIEFYRWLQWIAATQLSAAQDAAKQAGMKIGIMNDLAVGVHKYGADAWSLPGAYVVDMSVGAPPDMYNQLGQDWSQPPLNPRYLRKHNWEPLRGIIRTALRDCGALRIDHFMGLLRLWWIPDGARPNDGTYVRYDHEATVGILLLEAARAGAVVVGEDLGTVEDWVRGYMADRGILGTSVLWFEKNGDSSFRLPSQYREMCMAAVNTHDLPPTLGYLRAKHLIVQDKLGILPESLEQAQHWLHEDVGRVVRQLRELGMLETDEPTEWELILALHRFVGNSPAKLTVVSLVDAVGDTRMQNQPGTDEEYPNWRIPLADSFGRPIKIEELEYYVGVNELCQCMEQSIHPPQDSLDV